MLILNNRASIFTRNCVKLNALFLIPKPILRTLDFSEPCTVYLRVFFGLIITMRIIAEIEQQPLRG